MAAVKEEADLHLELYDDPNVESMDNLNENEILGTIDGASPNGGSESSGKPEPEPDLFETALVNRSSSRNSSSHRGSPSDGGMGGSRVGGVRARRFCCYVGNMTWWATDKQLATLINSQNIPGLVDIRFHENRDTGQSKGFALVAFESEHGVNTAMQKLPKHSLDPRKDARRTLTVWPFNKQSLAKLDAASTAFRRTGDKDKAHGGNAAGEDKSANYIGTVRIGPGPPVQQQQQQGPPPQNVNMGGPPRPMGMAPQMVVRLGPPAPPPMSSMGAPPGMAPPGMAPRPMPPPPMSSMPPPLQNMGTPPSVVPPPITNRPPPGFNPGMPPPPSPQLQQQRPQTPISYPSFSPAPGMPPPNMPPQMGPPPGAHVNPHVYPRMAPAPPAPQPPPVPPQPATPTDRPPQQPQAAPQQPQPQQPQQQAAPQEAPVISGAEFEEIMNRNRTVSSAPFLAPSATPPPETSPPPSRPSSPPSPSSGRVASPTMTDADFSVLLVPCFKALGVWFQTLVTAISLRQSCVANDDRCRPSSPPSPSGRVASPTMTDAVSKHWVFGSRPLSPPSPSGRVAFTNDDRCRFFGSGFKALGVWFQTLVTAISLRQSRIANDDRCRVLITSLQDTLHGVEAKSYSRRPEKRSGGRSRSPREQRSSKRRRRSRSRSSRERY